MKLALLSEGLTITPAAREYIDRRNHGRAVTPADYASTSGVILALEDDVWVNAPVADYNPNFVLQPKLSLELDPKEGLLVRGEGMESRATFWIPPAYHGQLNAEGVPFNSYAFTHGDRVRIAPIEGCSMACHFCDLPYQFRYRRKDVSGLVDSVARAAADEIQPASHVLISGGTPKPADFDYVNEVYEAVISGFPSLSVDIMMVPTEGLLDVAWLDRIGVDELSINIEAHNRNLARRIMRGKWNEGLDRYLDFIEDAAGALGSGRVRSMLMVGIEPMEDTLSGVRAIAERGGVPVLSPFRPDPATPMGKQSPPSRDFLREAYLRAAEIVADRGSSLGPRCAPCTHNTLTFSAAGSGSAARCHQAPVVV